MKKIIIILFLFFIPKIVLANSAKSAIVMDLNSGRILYEKNIHDKKLIASTTKIMTCIIVLENAKLNKEIIVGEEVNKMYGTNIYLKKGEKIKIKDLLYGLMLRSGNDAAITLAMHTFNRQEEFISKMNQKAKELGMNNTTFENPHGLDEETKNYSTAYDMALLSKYAYQNKTYRKIISTKKYATKSSEKSYVWYNRMSLLTQYNNCLGGKNGYTPKAGKTLVSISRKNNLTITVVSLEDSDIYNNHKALSEKNFKKYKNYTIINKKDFNINSSIIKGEYYIKKSFKYPLTTTEINNISTLINIYPNPKKNISGEIIVKNNQKKIGKIKIYQKKKR